MADESSAPHEIPPPRAVPWALLSRGVGVAADPKKLMLAALGLVLLHLGWGGLERLFPRSNPVIFSSTPAPLVPPRIDLPGDRDGLAAGLRSASWRVTEPVRYLVGPFLGVFATGNDARGFVHALLAAVWGVLVWGIIGGAIARIAVVQLARGERVGMAAAVRFAARRWLPLVGTPLGPLLGVAVFAVPCALFGLAYRVPAVGPTVAGALLILPLLAGLVMTLILIGLAAGWPLMTATVAAEAEDGFDALSRSYAYVNQRAGRYAACWGLAWLIGVVGLIVVDLFARVVVHLARWSLGFGAPAATLDALFGPGGGAGNLAGSLHGAWLSIVGLLAHGWIFSYFWTSAASIYLLMRQEVDGDPWHDVAPPDRDAAPSRPEPIEEPAGPSQPAAPLVAGSNL
jgi:hypothetical protein